MNFRARNIRFNLNFRAKNLNSNVCNCQKCMKYLNFRAEESRILNFLARKFKNHISNFDIQIFLLMFIQIFSGSKIDSWSRMNSHCYDFFLQLHRRVGHYPKMVANWLRGSITLRYPRGNQINFFSKTFCDSMDHKIKSIGNHFWIRAHPTA